MEELLSPSFLLLDELIIRLELTVKEFNEEMKVLVDELVKKEKERQQILEMMKISGSVSNVSESKIESETDTTVPERVELSEWERKLENSIQTHKQKASLLI